jgi:hypothetical protein
VKRRLREHGRSGWRLRTSQRRRTALERCERWAAIGATTPVRVKLSNVTSRPCRLAILPGQSSGSLATLPMSGQPQVPDETDDHWRLCMEHGGGTRSESFVGASPDRRMY